MLINLNNITINNITWRFGTGFHAAALGHKVVAVTPTSSIGEQLTLGQGWVVEPSGEEAGTIPSIRGHETGVLVCCSVIRPLWEVS